MAEALFYGSGTALITPFTNTEIDIEAWHELIERQLNAGTDALIVLGSTGEAPTITLSERKTLIKSAVTISNGRVPVIAAASSNCTSTSIDLAVLAREAGADGILLSAPYYNKPTFPGLNAHFIAVAEAARIPLIAYNVPSRTGINISPLQMAELAKHPLIRGLKEASTDAGQITEMLTLADGLAVYAGNDAQTVSVMAQGGRGVISVIGNIMPAEIRNVTNAMLNGDNKAAMEAYRRLSPLVKALSIETNPGPIKYAMSVMKLCENILRLPLAPVTKKTARAIREAMTKVGLPNKIQENS